jgi:hypothetical protein
VKPPRCLEDYERFIWHNGYTKAQLCNKFTTLVHRYLWTEYLLPPFFLLNSYFFLTVWLDISSSPVWYKSTVWSYLLYISHSVMDRKMQNKVEIIYFLTVQKKNILNSAKMRRGGGGGRTSTLADPNPNPNCYIRIVAKWTVMGHVRWLLQYLTSGVRQSRFYPAKCILSTCTCALVWTSTTRPLYICFTWNWKPSWPV